MKSAKQILIGGMLAAAVMAVARRPHSWDAARELDEGCCWYDLSPIGK